MKINKLAVRRAELHLKTRKADVTPKLDNYRICVSDALADLIHLCNKHDIDFDRCLVTAHGYVEADTSDTNDKNIVEIATKDESLCTCDNRSWYGEEHDTACELEGKR